MDSTDKIQNYFEKLHIILKKDLCSNELTLLNKCKKTTVLNNTINISKNIIGVKTLICYYYKHNFLSYNFFFIFKFSSSSYTTLCSI